MDYKLSSSAFRGSSTYMSLFPHAFLSFSTSFPLKVGKHAIPGRTKCRRILSPTMIRGGFKKDAVTGALAFAKWVNL